METRMLWYKAWLDTRWRFLIFLVVLALAACGVALSYPRAHATVMATTPEILQMTFPAGPIGDRIREAVALGATYRGYVWSQLFRNELPQMWCLFAIVIGTGGIVSQAVRGGGLFTLALPVSRHQLVIARTGVALAELLVLAVVPGLLVTVISPALGQSYSLRDALVHGGLLFTGGAVFFSITFLLSTIFADLWRPPLIMVAMFFVILTLRVQFPEFTRFTLAPVITGEAYFWGRGLPWGALLMSVAAAIVLLFLAARNVARRDF
jgi:ABC-2 type transport system permease protein